MDSLSPVRQRPQLAVKGLTCCHRRLHSEGQRTRVAPRYAPPLVLRFCRLAEPTRTKLGLAAGLTASVAHIPCASTVATEVVITIS